MFFLIGLALFGIGLLGEYVGRVYQQVRHRPRYLIEAILEGKRRRARSTSAMSRAGRLRLPQRRRALPVACLLAHGVDVAQWW
jgi:hypothetical protein